MKTRNRLLAALPRRDPALLAPHFKTVSFAQGEIMIDVGQRFKTVLFLESDAISNVRKMKRHHEGEPRCVF
jgi:hypothetical protein